MLCCSRNQVISWYLKLSWCVCRAAKAGFRSLVVQFLLWEAAWHEATDRGVSALSLYRINQSQSSCSFTLPVRQGCGLRCGNGDQHELCCQGDGAAPSGKREQWCRKFCLLLNNAAPGGRGEGDWPVTNARWRDFFFLCHRRFGFNTFLNKLFKFKHPKR